MLMSTVDALVVGRRTFEKVLTFQYASGLVKSEYLGVA
jgi:hypothetical protein